MLHDHEFFLACEPHMSKFERLASSPPPPPSSSSSSSSSAQPAMPGRTERVAGTGTGTETERFSVTDVVSTLPAGLWDSHVVSTYEFTDTPDGVFVRIKSPLSVVMDTLWTIRARHHDADADPDAHAHAHATLELVEDVSIHCSRLLLGVVKATFEGGWRAIHAKMIARLKDDASLRDHTLGGPTADQLRV